MINLLQKDLKLIINIKKQILTIVSFILILVIFSAMFSDYMSEKRLIDKLHVGIVDNEQSRLSGMLIGHFEHNEEFLSLFTIQVDSEAALLKAFNNNELSAIIYIPPSFTDSLQHFQNTPLKITFNPNYPLQNTVLENIMTSYSTYIKAVDVGIYSLYHSLEDKGLDPTRLNEINESFSVNMVLTALRRNKLFEHHVIETFPSASSSDYFLYAIIILLIIFASTSGSSVLAIELRNGCLERYKISGRHFVKFSLSKTLVMYLNIMMLLVPIFIIIRLINPQMLWSSFVLLVGFISLVLMFFVTLSISLGIFFNRYDMNLLISTMVTLILGILGGNFIPIQIMPKFIQDLSSITPNYWILRSCLLLNINVLSPEFYIISTVLVGLIVLLFIIQNLLIAKGVLWEK